MAGISKTIMSFYSELQKDTHHRFKSWEHCYDFFQFQEATDANIDLASLNLGFYLASWGMYRGSGFLLQKDYKIHFDVVKLILEEKYQVLRAIKPEDYLKDNNKIKLLFELIAEIKIKKYKDFGKVSDILVSKILLGTLGCVPAYDRYFVAGLGAEVPKYPSLTKKNFPKMINWCEDKDNKAELEKVQKKIGSYDKSNNKYPMMKLVDMYFWQIGEIKDIEEKCKTLEQKSELKPAEKEKLDGYKEKLARFSNL